MDGWGVNDKRTNAEIAADEARAQEKNHRKALEDMSYETVQIQRKAAGLMYDREFLERREKEMKDRDERIRKEEIRLRNHAKEKDLSRNGFQPSDRHHIRMSSLVDFDWRPLLQDMEIFNDVQNKLLQNNITKMDNSFFDNLLSEAQELAVKLNSLNDFMRTQKFIDLDRANKDLIYKQSRLMNEYLQVLEQRIELFGEKFSFKQ